MTPDPLSTLLHDWGWAGVTIYIMIKEIIPFIRDHLLPDRREARRQQAKVEDADRARLAALEERQVKAFEKVSESVQQISLAMSTSNERLVHIEDGINTLLDIKTQPRKAVEGAK